MSVMGTWHSPNGRDGRKQKTGIEEPSAGQMEFPLSGSGFDSVVFESIRSEGPGLPSKTGVEIWGTPDPIAFVEVGPETGDSKVR